MIGAKRLEGFTSGRWKGVKLLQNATDRGVTPIRRLEVYSSKFWCLEVECSNLRRCCVLDPGLMPALRPATMTARSSGTTCHALSGCTVKTTVLLSSSPQPRASSAQLACRACGGYPHSAASGAVQHRYRLGCADALSWLQSALPDRVSLQRRQTVYVSECLSSALAGQAACSLQCQHECSDLGQTGSATASGGAQAGFSMASLKRRAFNQHLLERISQYLAQGHSLEKSSPDYQDLCNYGTITDRAA